ncbi:dephospho-CoA kinase [Yunchengibacter salinarum]|uniref:dephospho-CoA kinase n=1 Tax=Yunchengibacter salinarum TaxID=3133399 RepID=UPI0035B5A1BA
MSGTDRPGERLKVLGLTGSIGMGKSTAAGFFRDAGVPVFDADATVRALQAPGGAALPAVEAAFPGVVVDGVLDRAALSRRVFADDAARRKLESILHPMVGEARARFFEDAARAHAPLVVLDVPLLFETGGDGACDRVAVVSAPLDVQRDRVMARPGMTEAVFEQVLATQMPDRDKRARADYVIRTGDGFAPTRRKVNAIIADMSGEKDGSPHA